MPHPYVRVDVWTLAENDPIITWYAKAVAAMQAKPATDPTSWVYQAAIHGSPSTSPLPGWNQCRHGSWYFVGWHRMYVYFFERIVRAQICALGGPEDWALPYWNYDGGGADNTLPLAFRNATTPNPPNPPANNPLYTSQRNPGINTGYGLPKSITSPAFALSRPLFTGAAEFGGGQTSPLDHFANQTGRLEQTPHNDVHVAIGGLMGYPDTAAEDPIFWLHHANIDRLWWVWQQMIGHTDPADPAWTGQSFPFFDVGGAPASLAQSGVVDIVTQLDYTYDEVPALVLPPWRIPPQARWPWPWPFPEEPAHVPIPTNPPDPEPFRQLVGATEEPVRLVGEAVRAPITVDVRTATTLQAQVATPDRQHRAFLDLDDIEAERSPATVYGVYVNLPDLPTDQDLVDHHVGNISLFGVERARNPRGDEHAHGLHVSMEITGLLDQMAADGSWTEGSHLDVTFRPLALEPPTGQAITAEVSAAQLHPEDPVTIGRVSVHFA